MVDLSQQAISAALRGEWQQALKLNQQILVTEGEHPDVLNRITRALAELGDIEKAKESAQRVLYLDPFNTIAQKALAKLNALKNGAKPTTTILSARIFLEEPGKTKIVPLIKLTEPSTLLTLDCGCEVKMNSHHHSISITTLTGQYIGRLPDDISNRLAKLMKKGNQYKSYIKCVTAHEVKLFIREIKRARSISHLPSFSAEKIHYVAFAPPELIHNKKSISAKAKQV